MSSFKNGTFNAFKWLGTNIWGFGSNTVKGLWKLGKSAVKKSSEIVAPQFTCPFCFHEYNKRKVLYVCPDCGTVANPGKFEREPIKCKNTGCGGLATVRRCPHCNQDIPRIALETPNLPFSIVGVSNSGKTNYITVMLQELGHSSGLRLGLGHQTAETLTHQNDNRRLIYELHTPPIATPSGERMPQIWYIRNLHKKSDTEVPTYTFTIFDGAGEDHEKLDPTVSTTVCRYINASKAIILTLDPLILQSVRNGGVVNKDVMSNSLGGDKGESKNAEDVLTGVANFIKAARGIKAGKMLDIPVAVVLTKFDTILNHPAFGPQALIKKSSLTVKNGEVDLSEIQQVDQEIRNWLEQIGEVGFINTLDSNFKEYYFFGVSSYGAPPKSATRLPDDIRPHRVLDPILWLFKVAKFVD